MIEIDHVNYVVWCFWCWFILHVLLKAASWVWCCSWLCIWVGFSLLAHADLAVAVTGLCFRASQWEKQHGNSYSYLPQLMCNIWNVLKCHGNSQHRNGRSKVWPQHATTCQAQSHRWDRDTAQELIVFSAVRSNRAGRVAIEDRNRCEEFDAERLIWTLPDQSGDRKCWFPGWLAKIKRWDPYGSMSREGEKTSAMTKGLVILRSLWII